MEQSVIKATLLGLSLSSHFSIITLDPPKSASCKTLGQAFWISNNLTPHSLECGKPHVPSNAYQPRMLRRKIRS